MKRRTVWIVLLVIIVAAFWSSFEFTINTAWGQDLTTDNVFSCRISTYRELRLFASKEPIKVTITLQHKLSQDLVFPNILHYQDIFSFHIEDKHGKVLSQNPASTENPTLGYKTLAPGRIYDLTMDIAALYDLSEGEEYSIRAKWKVPVGNKIYKGQSKPINIKIIPSADKDIINLIHRATQVSCSGVSENRAVLKLVQIGPRAVPALLEWVELEKLNKEIPQERNVWSYFNNVLEVLSQIGSDDARKIIIESQVGSDKYREALLKRIDIWQSPDRFEQLIEALDEPRLGKKWVIFKLGVLGDNRAIPVLEEIAQDDKSLDIREMAKDALAHLKGPNIPMRYIMHKLSERIELKTTKQEYRLGGPIEIHCKLIAGKYGSHKLAEFSNPCWHFLPWGRLRADEKISEPFRLRMQTARRRRMPSTGSPGGMMGGRRASRSKIELPRGITRHGIMIPVKELKSKKRRFADRKEEPLEGYISLNKLKFKGGFALLPEESREYILKDLSSAFEITEPGEYIIYEFPFGKSSSLSNRVTITILPPE